MNKSNTDIANQIDAIMVNMFKASCVTKRLKMYYACSPQLMLEFSKLKDQIIHQEQGKLILRIGTCDIECTIDFDMSDLDKRLLKKD
jgi:hypothetical protein